MTWWRPYVLEILFNDQSMMDVIAHQKEVYVYSFGLTAFSTLVCFLHCTTA